MILAPNSLGVFQTRSRVCLENAFCKMCVTVCGKFVPDEGVVAGYGNRIRDKGPAKWGVQIAGMIFQTGPNRKSAFYSTFSSQFPSVNKLSATFFFSN